MKGILDPRARPYRTSKACLVLLVSSAGLLVGCQHVRSQYCADGAVCPPGTQCAEDSRVCILVTCGDGEVDPNEVCDDANNLSGDGCPGDCSAPCGDGVLDPTEVCDDGNTDDGDGCSADCKTLDSIFLVSPTSVMFTASEGGALPARATITVRFAYRGDQANIGFRPGNPQPSWLSIMDGPSTENTATFELQPLDTSETGLRVTSVHFVVSHQNSTGLDTYDLPVAYDVEPSRLAVDPEIRFVAPYLGMAGRAGTLRARGRGFLAAGGKAAIAIGDLHIGPVDPDSDTQVTLSYPALPEGRYPVTLVDPQGIGPLNAELVVVTPPAFSYQAISAPGPRRRLVYDAERQMIYGVNRPGQQLDRFAYTGGTWSALAPHIIPQLTDIAMSPNGRTLVVLDQDAISEASLISDPFVLVPHAAIPDPLCGAFFDQAMAANNGKFFVVTHLTQCADTGIPDAYLYDTLDHSLRRTTEFYRGLAGGSADGSRVFIGDSGLPHAFPVVIFDALNNTVSDSVVDLDLTAITVSGDASRVILQNRFVYNRALTLTGNLPPSGVVLASRDASRAFIYVEDTGGQRLDVYNLNGPLQSGALYPLLRTIALPDSAHGGTGPHPPVTMTSSLDDDTVFISGDGKLLVVPAE